MGKVIFNFFIFIFLILSFSCKSENTTIKIGFLGGLTGDSLELADSGKNGSELAILEINQLGGINGHNVELVSRSHDEDKLKSFDSVKELVNEGCSVIIGPFLSSMAQSVIVATKESNILLISPTVSSMSFSGLKDNFIRVIPDASYQGHRLARAVIDSTANRVLLVIDENNHEYSTAVAKGFRNIVSGTSMVLNEIAFSGTLNEKFMYEKILNESPDSVVFITNGLNTAKIIKSLENFDSKTRFYGSTWVKASGFPDLYNKSMEGIICVDTFQNTIPTIREIDFNKKYQGFYGSNPTIGAKLSYESVYLFKQAVELSNSLNTKMMVDAIISLDEFEGVSENYSFDTFGDVYRKSSLYKFSNGEFNLID